MILALSGMLPGASAQTSPTRPIDPEAVALCERAARQSLTSRSAPAADVRFVGTPREEPATSSDSRLLRGAGTWRGDGGQRRFSYSCSVDVRAPDTVGLVLRDTTPTPVDVQPMRRTIEPDLSHVSPTACESSAAAALKKRWPRVSEISFDSGSRRFSQESTDRAELRGQGRALPEAGSPLCLFEFGCEIDPRDGRVLGTQISG